MSLPAALAVALFAIIVSVIFTSVAYEADQAGRFALTVFFLAMAFILPLGFALTVVTVAT